MRNLKKISIVYVVLLSAIALTAFIWNHPVEQKEQEKFLEGNSFVVLELFTSEGCNSCPPAEELFARLAQDYKNKAVYLLNYHVDYFDKLGWKDAFGSSENTNRQHRYSSWLLSQVYTPQLVVNGSSEFIGSNEKQIRNAISGQQNALSTATLTLSAAQTVESVKAKYEVTNVLQGDELQLALVQKNGSTNILRGENEGLNFSHVQIVRKIVRVSLKDQTSGTIELNIPKTAMGQQLEIIGLVQNSKSGKILAANAVEL